MTDSKPCRKLGCDVAKTGVCDEGNDPVESCPEYGADEAVLDHGDDDEESERPRSADRPTKPGRRLRGSELLSREDLWPLRKAVQTTTVSLIGDVKAGKTTLIAALYERFCKGPFAGYNFKSSRTLTAFARRHHRALERSGRDMPIVPRTSRQDGVGFFHLNVVSQDGDDHHLIIADRSGEDFRAARQNTGFLGVLWELEMADRVCFILDAGRAANVETRIGYKRSFRQQIRVLLDNDALPEGAALQIVSTKLDKLAPQGLAEPDVNELADFEASLSSEFSGRSIEIQRICALPRANYLVGPVGLDGLLQSWLRPKVIDEASPFPADSPARWIDRMLVG